MKKKILFIVNNLSGTVSKFNIEHYLDKFLNKEIFDPTLFYIDKNIKKSEYKATLEADWDIIVPVGGDGTLLKLGKRIIDKKVLLGIIPIGSGNGLATHLGYKPRDIEGAFKVLNTMKTQKIDVAQYNGDNYYFSNLGYGIDAHIAKKFKSKKKRSFWVYSYLTIKSLWGLKPFEVKYSTPNSTDIKVVTSYLFNVFNSNLYGYNVGLIPWANAMDGKLDIAYIDAVSFWKLPWIAFCVMIKKPFWSKHIHFSEVDEVTIHIENKIEYQVDGDPKKSKKDIHIKVLPQKLHFIVP